MSITDLHTNWTYGSYYNDRDNFIKEQENPYLADGKTKYLSPYWDGSIAIGYGFDLLVRSDDEIEKLFNDSDLGVGLSDKDKSLLSAARVYVGEYKNKVISASDLASALKEIVKNFDLKISSEPDASKLLDEYIHRKWGQMKLSFVNS